MKNRAESTTSEKLLDIAECLFAAKGFYGVSIREIAENLTIAKSTLLHHYPTKEKLYAALLKKLADEMTDEIKRIRRRPGDEKMHLVQFVELLCDNSCMKLNRDMIILRELLDNPERAPKAKKWFFADYLENLTQIIREGQKRGIFKKVNPEVFILQLLGAHHYLIISLPTVKRFLDPFRYRQILKNHKAELEAFIEERLLSRDP